MMGFDTQSISVLLIIVGFVFVFGANLQDEAYNKFEERCNELYGKDNWTTEETTINGDYGMKCLSKDEKEDKDRQLIPPAYTEEFLDKCCLHINHSTEISYSYCFDRWVYSESFNITFGGDNIYLGDCDGTKIWQGNNSEQVKIYMDNMDGETVFFREGRVPLKDKHNMFNVVHYNSTTKCQNPTN